MIVMTWLDPISLANPEINTHKLKRLKEYQKDIITVTDVKRTSANRKASTTDQHKSAIDIFMSKFSDKKQTLLA